MPNASASRVTERIELSSCPGGFVDLRTMSFGEWQQRQDIMMNISVEMAERGKQQSANLSMRNEVVTQFEFQRCIVDHNLEDDQGRKLNFMTRMDLAMLDPKVGNEIGELIRKRHEWLEGSQEDFTNKPNS